MNGYFSEEALQRFAEMAAQTQSADFAEGDTYDFTRCVRPNGTAYGTTGKCRKGTEQEKAGGENKGFKGNDKGSSSVHKHLLQHQKKHPITQDFIKRAQKLAKEQGVDLSYLKPEDWRSHVSRAVSSGGYGGAIQKGVESLVELAGSSLRNPKVAEEMEPDFSEDETFDFTRCVRPDGTAYGTRGRCKKGSEQAKQVVAPAPRKPRAAKPAAAKRGAAGYNSASDKERADELDKYIKKGSAGKPQAATGRQAEVNARLKQIENEQKAKKTGSKGYEAASDKERADELDKYIKKGSAGKPQAATGRQAEINARLKQIDKEQRAAKTGSKGYEAASDKERAAALDKEMGDSGKYGAEREKPSAKQAATNARAKQLGF